MQLIPLSETNHPALKDADRDLTRQLGTTSYPSTYVVACDGRVMAKTEGEWTASQRKKLNNAINEALKMSCE